LPVGEFYLAKITAVKTITQYKKKKKKTWQSLGGITIEDV
jgi:hypothetical protein